MTPAQAAQLCTDVSDHQGTNDWPAYRRAGHRSAACKATEGRTFKASTFPTNWKAMEAVGVEVRMAYHFAHPASNPPETEARELLRTVFAAFMRSTDLLVLDIEHSPRSSQRLNREWIQRFCGYVAAHAGRGPLIYSGGWWWKPHVGAWFPTRNCLGYCHSAYTTNDRANLISPHRRYILHQFTNGQSGGTPRSLAGIGRCDVNRWREPFDHIRQLARGTPTYRDRFIHLRHTWPSHLRRP